MRPIGMLERLIGTVLEMLLTSAIAALARLFGVDNAVEFATALVGLGIIAAGCVLWWLGS